MAEWLRVAARIMRVDVDDVRQLRARGGLRVRVANERRGGHGALQEIPSRAGINDRWN